MKNFATSIAFAIFALALLPACGGKSKKRECKPCNKSKVEKKAETHHEEAPRRILSDKEAYAL